MPAVKEKIAINYVAELCRDMYIIRNLARYVYSVTKRIMPMSY